MPYRAIVIGASAGDMEALQAILCKLPQNFALPILVVQHMLAGRESYLKEYFSSHCQLHIKEAESNMPIDKSTVYFAPPDYHMLIEKDFTISLSVEEKVNHSRPSIDVLFETAADAYGRNLIGIILTGANQDGAKGLKTIHQKGGVCIVQDPETALMHQMPLSAIQQNMPDYILPLDKIGELLLDYKAIRREGSHHHVTR